MVFERSRRIRKGKSASRRRCWQLPGRTLDGEERVSGYVSPMRGGTCSATTTGKMSRDHNSGTGVTRSGDGDGTTPAWFAGWRRAGRIGPVVGTAWWSVGANTDSLRHTSKRRRNWFQLTVAHNSHVVGFRQPAAIACLICTDRSDTPLVTRFRLCPQLV